MKSKSSDGKGIKEKLWLSVSWNNSPTTFSWSVEVDLDKPFKFIRLSNGRIGFTQLIK